MSTLQPIGLYIVLAVYGTCSHLADPIIWLLFSSNYYITQLALTHLHTEWTCCLAEYYNLIVINIFLHYFFRGSLLAWQYWCHFRSFGFSCLAFRGTLMRYSVAFTLTLSNFDSGNTRFVLWHTSNNPHQLTLTYKRDYDRNCTHSRSPLVAIGQLPMRGVAVRIDRCHNIMF